EVTWNFRLPSLSTSSTCALVSCSNISTLPGKSVFVSKASRRCFSYVDSGLTVLQRKGDRIIPSTLQLQHEERLLLAPEVNGHRALAAGRIERCDGDSPLRHRCQGEAPVGVAKRVEGVAQNG